MNFFFRDFVADEVRGRIGFLFQNPEVTIQLFAQDLENRGLGKDSGKKNEEK